MNYPSDLKYTEDHEWIRVSEDGTKAFIGITDFAQSELGEVVYVEVETIDEELDSGEVFGIVEAVKTTSDLFMPVKGKVIAFNEKLDSNADDQPELVNSDPYGDGWIIQVELSDPSELEKLMDAEAYQDQL